MRVAFLLLLVLLYQTPALSPARADQIIDGALGFAVTDMVATAEVSDSCMATGAIQPDARNVRYAVVPIHARDPAGAVLDAEILAAGTSILDTLLALYCFHDPADPFAGLVAFDDDGGSGLLSWLSPGRNIHLAPDRTYHLVIAPFDPASIGFGQFQLRLGEGVFPGYSPTEGAVLPSIDPSIIREVVHQPLLSASVEGTSLAIFEAIEASLSNRPGPFQPFLREISFQEISSDPALPFELGGTQYWAGFSHQVDDRFILGLAGGYEENHHTVAGGLAFGDGRGTSVLAFGAVRPDRHSLVSGLIGYGAFEYDLFTAGGLREVSYDGDRVFGAVSATYNVAALGGRRLFLRGEAGLAHERLDGAVDNLDTAVPPTTVDATWAVAELRYHDEVAMPFRLGTARPWTTLAAVWHPSDLLDLETGANRDWSLRIGGGTSIAHTPWLSTTISGGTDYRGGDPELRTRAWASFEIRWHIAW
ncbi:MAG: autotransporter outer membrane beta-barrel domain-containing protein [Azospirillaceae bacterium]